MYYAKGIWEREVDGMSIIKDALILCIITLLAGLSLGYVNDLTKEPIAKAQEEAKQKAYKSVFKNADSFTEIENYSEFESEINEALKADEFSGVTIDEVLYAMSADEIKGCVLTVTSGNGYGGDITLSVGIQADGKVNGIAILSISETPGLGAKAAEDRFLNQYADKNVEEFEYTKSGKSADNEIDAISGATITTSAVTEAVNAGIVVAGIVNGR